MIFVLTLFLFHFLALPAVESAQTFSIDFPNNQFLKDGKPFRYIAGDFEYFKVPAVLWKDRLQKFKAAGLNAIQMYISWNFHEPEKGVYDFYGDNDFLHLFNISQELGLVVVLRPGPFINAEVDMGGLPYWLLNVNKHMKLRTMDPSYIGEITPWLNKLLPMIKPYLYNNGGPVIMVQIENEYGFWPEFTKIPCDYAYMAYLRDLFHKLLGNDTVLFTTDGWEFVNCGKTENVFSTVDFGSAVDPVAAFKKQRERQEFGPYVNSEYYPGWINRWEMPYEHVDTKQVADTLDKILALNASVNIYPMAGGTLFGFSNGATHAKDGAKDFHPVVTSYEFDGPITEAGDPNEKYVAIRNVIGKYVTLPAGGVPAVAPKMELPPIKLHPIGSIFDLAGASVSSHYPRTFEELNIAHGFVLYSTIIKYRYTDPTVLTVPNLRDRAQVFVDQEYRGTLSRTQEIYELPLRVKPDSRLDIFVENQGRYAFLDVGEMKGIIENVTLGPTVLTDWNQYQFYQNWTTSVAQLEAMPNQNRSYRRSTPTFFTGNFTLPMGKAINDTFLRVDGFGKGVAFVNGFNLGRYWPLVGPQITLYSPANLFKAYPAENRITLFELEESPCEDLGRCLIQFVKEPVLNGPTPHV